MEWPAHLPIVGGGGVTVCYFHGREVGFIQRLYIISTTVRSGYRRFIIIIITTTPFDVEGREVGCPTVYEGFLWYDTSLVYMVWYIIDLYGMVHRWFIWYDT